MKIYLKLIYGFCGTMFGLLIFCSSSFAEIGGYTEQIRIQKLTEFMQSMDKPLVFYGKIVDYSGQPVGGATMYVHVHHSNGIKDISLTSDDRGLFELNNEIGNGIYFQTIDKPGYEFSLKDADTEMTYPNDGSFVPDKNNPVVFKVRKKLPSTVVVPGKITVVFTPKKKVKYYEVDLIEMADGGPYELKEYRGDHAHADLKARLEHEEGGVFYTFILQTPDADSGMLAIDEPLYSPPASGYEKEFKVILSSGQKKETWLYVKSRSGQLYSRLEIKFAVEKGEAYFAANVLSNPLGERNFDRDSEKLREWIRQKAANRKYMAPRQ